MFENGEFLTGGGSRSSDSYDIIWSPRALGVGPAAVSSGGRNHWNRKSMEIRIRKPCSIGNQSIDLLFFTFFYIEHWNMVKRKYRKTIETTEIPSAMFNQLLRLGLGLSSESSETAFLDWIDLICVIAKQRMQTWWMCSPSSRLSLW